MKTGDEDNKRLADVRREMESVLSRKARNIHGLINYTDTKAKCRYLKFTCKGTLRQVIICLIPPPPRYTLYTSMYLFTHGRGGGKRRLKGQQFTKLGRKYMYQDDWMYLQSINSDKHLNQNPFTGKFF